MSFQSLPNEVVAHILHAVFEPESGSKPEFLRLRLACRQFDDHVSRIVLQASSPLELDIGRKLHWRPSIEWMLTTKARIQRFTQGPFAFIHDAAEYLIERELIPQLTEDEALVAACRAIVAVQEPSWIVNHLVTWEPGNLLPQSLQVVENYTHKQKGVKWQDKVESPEAFYGMMHLLLACRYGTEVEAVVSSSETDGAVVTSIDFHPVFGDAMRSAIVLDHVIGISALIRHGIDPSVVMVDGKKINTLAYAAEMNREGAVNTILVVSKKIKVNSKSESSHTTLGWAARRGWTDTVRLLLQRDDIDPNLANRFAETPLAAAARHDNEEITRLLLGRTDIKPPLLTEKNCPLWVALKCGSTKVTRLYLDRFKDEIDINAHLRSGHTALSLVVDKGFTPLVRVLLEFPGIDPGGFDVHGVRPLEHAVRKGHTEIVRILLSLDIDNEVRIQGKLLEQIALEQNDEEIFQLLITKALQAGDSRGKELLRRSLDESARVILVRALTKSLKFLQNNKISFHRLLVEVARQGQIEVVRELLRHDQVDLNYDGGKPLLSAMRAANVRNLLPLFLARKDLQVNRVDRKGTALLAAISTDNTAAIELLMTAPGIDVNLWAPVLSRRLWKFDLRRCENFTGYHLSCKRPFTHEWAWGEPPGQTNPLLAAAARIDEGTTAFEMIYDDPRTVRDVRDGSNRTALWWAVNFSNLSMVRKILDTTPNVADVLNVQDDGGWAPLHIVSNNSFGPILKALLRRPEIDPNVVTNQGWTPLHMAMVTCSKQLTRMLLNRPKIDTSLKLNDGRTAFELHEGCECDIASMIIDFEEKQAMKNGEHQDSGLVMVSRPAVESQADSQDSGP